MELLSLFTFRRPRPDVNLAIHGQGTGGTRPPHLELQVEHDLRPWRQPMGWIFGTHPGAAELGGRKHRFVSSAQAVVHKVLVQKQLGGSVTALPVNHH